MKDRHYYLVRTAGSDEIRLVYIFGSDTLSNGVTYYDISTKVFYDQKKWGLWGWDCGTSVIDFEQNVKFEEILAEVSKEEVDALFQVMREATDEAARWIDESWKPLAGGNEQTCRCMYELGKYPYFSFMNDETHEHVCLWSDLLIHDFITDTLISPEGTRSEYYAIPQTVFEKACELHKEKSNKFVHQYRDFVHAKTGITIPLKEYTPEEIEEEKAKLKKHEEEMRALLYGSSTQHQ